MGRSRRLEVRVVDPDGEPAFSARWPAGVLAVPAIVLVLLVAGAATTWVLFWKARERIREYATLNAEVEALRRQNERLRILEAELTELRELQQQMLRLAGIETALGVDLQMLEDLREAAPRDTAGVDPRLLVWPIDGEVTAGFGLDHPGVDIEAPRGQTVLSAGVGVVEETGSDRKYGRRVTIRHADGMATTYANLALHIVDPGDSVALGQVIGLVGVGGEGTTPHLHFEVRRDGTPVDPGEVVRSWQPRRTARRTGRRSGSCRNDRQRKGEGDGVRKQGA